MIARHPLVDTYGRVHTNLRISVTDRCNIRCFYCMPATEVVFRPRHELLTFEEITRFVRVVTQMGVNKIRITGGEPLVRQDVSCLVSQLAANDEIDDIAMTTNGILLTDVAGQLRQAGLNRLNISLDTLEEATFRKITRRDGLDKVLRGIFAARDAGFERIRLNALAIRGLSEGHIIPLADFARKHQFELRFIEFMPLDAESQWQSGDVLTGDEIRTALEAHFGPLESAARPDRSQPAMDFRFADGVGRIGLINPVSQAFCGTCNRLRLTAEGQIRNCLFSTIEWDVKTVMREGGSDDEIAELVRACVWNKKPGHGIDEPGFLKPQRAMYQIGG